MSLKIKFVTLRLHTAGINSMTIFPICYLAPIEFYSALLASEEAVFELHEYFIKQTYRNRCCIYGANGKLNLIVPVKHTGERTLIKDVKIANETNWKKIHWRSMEAAYRNSAYFEFYEHIFAPVYERRFHFLTDFNFALQEEVLKILGVNMLEGKQVTASYQKELPQGKDSRNSFIPGKHNLFAANSTSYRQVFSGKYGFIPNLSIVDMLFNLGPEAGSYLRATE